MKPNISGVMKIIKKSLRNLHFSSTISFQDGSTNTKIRNNSKLIKVSNRINNKELVKNTIGNNNGSDKLANRLMIFNL